MSESTDTIRGAYEAFAQGKVPAVLEILADDVSWDVPKSLPNGGVHEGRDSVAQFFAGLADAYGELRVEPDEYLEAGDKVIASGHHRGRGHNGVEFEARFVHTWTIDGGRASEFVEVADTAEITPAMEGAAA
jgi:uncharacterized protein